MRYLRLFEEVTINDKYRIDFICKHHGIENYTINSDGLVDVDGHVFLENCNLIKIPVKFGTVKGSFRCCNNKITSLKGTPRYINGLLNCDYNQIRSFEGFPNSVRFFSCDYNPIDPIWSLFNRVDKIELFNDYDIIQDNTIILDRLKDFLIEIGRRFQFYKIPEFVDRMSYYNYKFH